MNWSLSELGLGVGAIAFFWGILSAVSLPLGAGAGVRFRPGKLPSPRKPGSLSVNSVARGYPFVPHNRNKTLKPISSINRNPNEPVG